MCVTGSIDRTTHSRTWRERMMTPTSRSAGRCPPRWCRPAMRMLGVGPTCSAIWGDPSQRLVDGSLFAQRFQLRKPTEPVGEIISGQVSGDVLLVQLCGAVSDRPRGLEADGPANLGEVHAVGAGVGSGLARDRQLRVRYHVDHRLRDIGNRLIV